MSWLMSVLDSILWLILHSMVNHILFIHSGAGGHLGGFHLLAAMNDAALNICVQGFMWTYVFIPFGYLDVEFLGHIITLYLII